ncbi:MAG: hypothetical protein KY476_23345, partial [Planctomycetes bacterium]|nr:hypothetical protein [Planctomycetota bacterium]
AIVDKAVDLPAEERAARVVLGTGFVPEELAELVSISDGAAEIVTWDRAEPLLQHVLLSDVQMAEVPRIAEGVGAADFENLGWEVLADGREGPLALKKRSQTRLWYQLLFHTDRSTLPYRVGFPILVSNLVEVARHNSRLGEVRAAQTGVLPVRELEPDKLYGIEGPRGFQAEVRSRRDGTLSGVPAPRVGEYVLSTGGGEAVRLGVSLLDTRETSLVAVDAIQFDELSVEASGAELQRDRPLWPMLALAGFGVLLVEWWFFQRRVPQGAGPGSVGFNPRGSDSSE